MSLIGWIIIGIVIVIAATILWAADQPGHRRRRQDPRYQGPDRRGDKTVVDFLDYPVFTSPYCRGCDKIKQRRGDPCPPDCAEPHSFDETES
jgi:hypothetical protein